MGFLSKLLAPPPPKVIVHKPVAKRSHNGQCHRVIKPDVTPLSVKRGWKKSGNTWTGSYATYRGTWRGKITRRGDVIDVFIKQPPPDVRGHKRFICFHKHKAGWWKIHLHTQPVNPNDFDSVIAYVEQLLTQSLKAA